MLDNLKNHYKKLTSNNLDNLFIKDPKRFNKYSVNACDILLDYSKNWISKETLRLYQKFLKQIDFDTQKEKMFTGEKINTTENRAVLHTALRNSSDKSIFVDGKNVLPLIKKELNRIEKFCNDVHGGKFVGHSGKRIKYVVNIGIGGSDLGPHMVTEALRPFHKTSFPEIFFVSNVDGAHIKDTLSKINIEQTLFLIASKTFTTQETMANAEIAKKTLLEYYQNNHSAIKSHFAALSTNKSAVEKFGINKNYMFIFWDWVGGRYSLWSSIGLSIALFLGMDNFKKLLAGAENMDNHFRNTPISENIPILLAIIGFGNNNFLQMNSHAILPYSQHLHRFPSFIQQLDMESNGKSVTKDGKTLHIPTGPVIWGESGTNGQHAFYQLIHQGTQIVPCDFIAVVNPQHDYIDSNNMLVANCIAQSQALLMGRKSEEVIREMNNQNKSDEEIKKLLAHKTFKGNRPSNTIILKELNPYTLGSLIAMYEHKIFTQGIMWDINSFDQFGVELGKVLTNKILKHINKNSLINSNDCSFDSSTRGIISYVNSNLIKNKIK